jgi:hypothetical protein
VFAAQALGQSRGELSSPLPHCLIGEDETAGQKHLRQIPQAELVAQAPEHHDGHDIARVMCLVQYVGTVFVELFATSANGTADILVVSAQIVRGSRSLSSLNQNGASPLTVNFLETAYQE